MTNNWRSSFHGGHSGQFCEHATGSLSAMVKAAIAQGITLYGLSEHCPRYRQQDLYLEEIDNGYTVDKLISSFENYSQEAVGLQQRYKSQVEILVGFETEYVSEQYLEVMLDLKAREVFDYIVGSVHHVQGICIDAYPHWTEKAIKACGGVELFAIDYYQSLERLVEALQPQIVGHFDLIKKFADKFGSLNTSAIREQVEKTLLTIKKQGSLLDLNVYPFRKGKCEPYPAKWIVELAKEEGIGFCLGDDSHSPETVGVGLDEGRDYLLQCKIDNICGLRSSGQSTIVERRQL